MVKAYYVCFCLVSCGIIRMFSVFAQRYDGENFGKTKGREPGIGAMWTVSVLMAAAVKTAAENLETGAKAAILLFAVMAGCFCGSLIFACIADIRMREVYDFCWYASIAAALFLWVREPLGICELSETGIFFLIQQKVFVKFFGKADCHAFCVCAMFERALGMGAEGFFGHMVIAYALLILHQIVRGNVGKSGKLKTPVPFLPYITGAFFVNILQFHRQF